MFFSKFFSRNENSVSETHFGEVRGDARPWLMARWKARSRLSIRVNRTFFRYLLPFRGYKAKCVQLGCFHKGRRLCSQILPGQGCLPSTILGVRKLDTVGYPTAKTASLCVPSFWHNTTLWQTDRQTDRQTNRH